MNLIRQYALKRKLCLTSKEAYVLARDKVIFSEVINLTFTTRGYKTLNDVIRQDIAADLADGLAPYRMVQGAWYTRLNA